MLVPILVAVAVLLVLAVAIVATVSAARSRSARADWLGELDDIRRDALVDGHESDPAPRAHALDDLTGSTPVVGEAPAPSATTDEGAAGDGGVVDEAVAVEAAAELESDGAENTGEASGAAEDDEADAGAAGAVEAAADLEVDGAETTGEASAAGEDDERVVAAAAEQDDVEVEEPAAAAPEVEEPAPVRADEARLLMPAGVLPQLPGGTRAGSSEPEPEPVPEPPSETPPPFEEAGADHVVTASGRVFHEYLHPDGAITRVEQVDARVVRRRTSFGQLTLAVDLRRGSVWHMPAPGGSRSATTTVHTPAGWVSGHGATMLVTSEDDGWCYTMCLEGACTLEAAAAGSTRRLVSGEVGRARADRAEIQVAAPGAPGALEDDDLIRLHRRLDAAHAARLGV